MYCCRWNWGWNWIGRDADADATQVFGEEEAGLPSRALDLLYACPTAAA